MSRPFAVVDTETTGLDPRIHQPFELSIWHQDAAHPTTFMLPHSLQYADGQALAINRYIERGIVPWEATPNERMQYADEIIRLLSGVTLVGANPAFDAAMIQQFLGCQIWHHRLTNISEAARWVFDWPQQEGLADVIATLRRYGYDIPAPDHTAEGDVRATRAAYEALVELRHQLGPIS